MKEKGFAPVILIAVIALVGLLVISGFFIFQKIQHKIQKVSPPSTQNLQIEKSKLETTVIPVNNLRADSVLSMASNGNYWLVSYPCDGLIKYDGENTTPMPRLNDRSDSWINNIEWNGNYWLFSSKDVFTCLDGIERKASLQSFDGGNFTNLTESFKSVSDCPINNTAYISWNGKKFWILSFSSTDPKIAEYCATGYDGNNFENRTEFLRKSLDLKNFSIRAFDCNQSFCVISLEHRNENEFSFFKINFENSSVSLISPNIFTDYSGNSSFGRYADILVSNEKSFVLSLKYKFYGEESKKVNASTINELYEYDGGKAQLLYKYTSPYISEERPIEEISKAYEGLFEPKQVVWDPFRAKWFIIGITPRRGNVENELTILEVTKDYKTEKLTYDPPIVNKATDIEGVAVTKEGVLIEEPFTGIFLMKFKD